MASQGWSDTYRGAVRAWESDTYEHFTIAYYHDRFADATLNLLARAGLGPEHIRTERHALATTRTYGRFLSELRGGDLIHVRSGILSHDERGARAAHELYNSATGELAATLECVLRYMDLDRRRGTSLDEAQRARLEPLRVDWEAPAPPGHAPLPDARPRLPTMSDVTKPWEIDVLGHISLSFYIHRFSDAVNQFLSALGMSPPYLRDNRIGFSTFELEGRYRAELQAGARIACTTALAHLGKTSLRVVSYMHNLDSGALVAELSQAGVHLDLDARRPSPIPGAIRERAAPLLHDAGPDRA